MKLRTMHYYFRQGLKNVNRNFSLSCASIVSITAGLFVLGMILAFVLNLDYFMQGMESRMDVTVFLKSDTTTSEIEVLGQVINGWSGVTRVEFVSRHEALQEWKVELGDQGMLLEGYTDENNPLPDFFVVSAGRPEYVDPIAKRAEYLDEVEKVSYSKPVVDFIERLANVIRITGVILVLILLFISTIIISNTIRVTVFSRRKEIGIMKNIGATDWFIRWPFILEGLILGLAGALLSLFMVLGLYSIVYYYAQGMTNIGISIDFLNMLKLSEIVYPLLAVFLILGSGIGILSSVLSLRRHLKV